jgi:MoxR-like ATPase
MRSMQAPAVQTNDPAWAIPLTPILGRVAEVARLCALLAEDARLVTVTGPGGVGKTRLAGAVIEAIAAAPPPRPGPPSTVS